MITPPPHPMQPANKNIHKLHVDGAPAWSSMSQSPTKMNSLTTMTTTSKRTTTRRDNHCRFINQRSSSSPAWRRFMTLFTAVNCSHCKIITLRYMLTLCPWFVARQQDIVTLTKKAARTKRWLQSRTIYQRLQWCTEKIERDLDRHLGSIIKTVVWNSCTERQTEMLQLDLIS